MSNVKMKTATIKELKEELNMILPHGVECNDQTILDMSQFIDHYLYKMKEAMIKAYPSSEERIKASYDHVLIDNKIEVWLTE